MIFIKKAIFSILVVFFFFFFGELFCRVKLFFESDRNLYYLTAPFFKEESKKEVIDYKLDVSHFLEDKAYKEQKKNRNITWKFWHHGENWYYKMKPGLYQAQKPYERIHYTVNSFGFRGEEFNVLDKDGKIRIFCIGESSTFGGESSDDQTWPARLSYYLGDQYEVINSGFGSYTSLNYLNLIRYELVDYKPDIFIIYAGINDLNIYRNYEKKSYGAIWALHGILYYRWSMLYTLLNEKVSVLVQKSPLPMNIYDNRAKKNYLDNTEKIINICKNHNIDLIFVRQMIYCHEDLFLSDNVSMKKIKIVQNKNRNDKDTICHADYLTVYRTNETMTSLMNLCSEYSLSFLDFRKDFFDAMKADKDLFFDYVHLKPEANDLLANLVAQKISKARQ